jgi:imidazolonepropionase-like amidohydrolase
MALQGGVDDVCHMVVDQLPDSLIARMVQADMYWVPTLELWKGVSDMYNLNWDENAIANLKRFVEAGGKVATGTDFDGYITPFQLGMPILEMQLMQDAGMTIEQIILASTKNAAYVCNMEEELGTLEPGKIADIIAVKENPLEDLEALQTIQLVIHNGRIIRIARLHD